MFFVESERGKTRDERIAAAKTMCATCPVLQACRDYGLNAQEPYGIWGGLTAQERKTHLQHSTPAALPVGAHRYSTQP